MSFVLTPLTTDELKSFFDKTAITAIEYFLKKACYIQPELLPDQKILPIQIPKEHIEQWFVQALGVRPVGAGSYPIDIVGNNWGADVKMLSCKIAIDGKLTNSDSGETSLAQKFSDDNFGENNTLDELFNSGQQNTIWDYWKTFLINKYEKAKQELKINNIYYFILLRAGSIFHLCGLSVDLNCLKETIISKSRSTGNSIWIDNFIENSFGHVKIYKAKKRLELRLKPKHWVQSNQVLTFETSVVPIKTSIRSIIIANEFETYIKDSSNKILDII